MSAVQWRPSGEDAVRRYVDVVRPDIEPDPLFRRRLRGTVVNRFIAERDGVGLPAGPRGSRMGRLGRACLYASVAAALSVGGVMAASETAIPGDFLYPLKRSVEDLRMAIAPVQLRDELAAHALAERIDELSRVVESGASAQVAGLAVSIRASYEEIVASGDGSVLISDRLAGHLARLDAVLEGAPVRAQRAVERAMSGALGFEDHGQTAPGRSGEAGGDDEAPAQGTGSQQGGASGSTGGGGQPAPPGQFDGEPPNDDGAEPDRTQRPERSPKPHPTASPSPP